MHITPFDLIVFADVAVNVHVVAHATTVIPDQRVRLHAILCVHEVNDPVYPVKFRSVTFVEDVSVTASEPADMDILGSVTELHPVIVLVHVDHE